MVQYSTPLPLPLFPANTSASTLVHLPDSSSLPMSALPSATSSLSLLTHALPLSLSPRRRRNLLFISPITFLTRHRHRLRIPAAPISAAIADNTTSDHLSWFSPDNPAIDGFNGWAFHETPITEKKRGFPTFLIAGIGSVALLVFALAHFSRTQNGFISPFRSPFPGWSMPFVTEEKEPLTADSDASHEASTISNLDVVSEFMTPESHQSKSEDKRQPWMVTVAVDSIQQEALSVLKKLKIIDEDVEAGQLCSRREYARWLVRASSLLERNPKYKITKAVALAGSVIPAFEDVSTGDEDFDSVQALAEAGVVPSKLSSKYMSEDGDEYFYPERFISRRDLIDWRAQVEYDFAMTGNQEILKTQLSLMDVKEIRSDQLPGLLMDMLAGDKSLLRRVFGQIKRLGPNKPCTVAQAAVALTSGRMTEAINNELIRIEDEESSRQAAKEEIKKELLDRGEIRSYWAQKMEEEKAHGQEVQLLYLDVLKELEEEKIVQEIVFSGYVKEKAAMDCQKQLLNGLKEEVREMSEKLVSERGELIAEEETVQTVRQELQAKKEGIVDAKSVLEAEIEALRILRSWIEDEARKSQGRWKVLEEVGRRWKWDRQ